MRLMFLVVKPDGMGEKLVESGSPCLDVQVTSTRQQQCEQSMTWVAVVLNDFLCFPKASCRNALHSWEMAADDAHCCLHHRLEGLPISSGAAAEPGRNAARKDAINGAPIKVCEGLCRHANLLQSTQKVTALLGSFYSQVSLPG